MVFLRDEIPFGKALVVIFTSVRANHVAKEMKTEDDCSVCLQKSEKLIIS